MQWSQLDPTTQEDLEKLQKASLLANRMERTEKRVANMLKRLRAFGKWPREHAYSLASNPDIIAEAQLAHDLRKCRSSGILNEAAVAEIDELHWIWLREREAEAMERNAAAQDRRRDAAKARTTRLRTLLKNLPSSKSRCDCNDFAHWYGLWRCNPELAIHLRSAGHHFEHCRLVRSAVRPVHAMAGEWYSEFSSALLCSQGSCLDPDTGEEVDSQMSRSSVFESAGLRASCSECGHAIVCGVLHSGSCNQELTCGDGCAFFVRWSQKMQSGPPCSKARRWALG